jgi:NAD(P)-dependent dehydrogenase (short-subunit alcohol dehydrogenase family)
MRLKNKVAVITGAGSGIGRAVALLFAKEGANVVVVDIDEKGGTETVKEITSKNGEAYFVKADVAKEDEVIRMVNTVIEKFRRVDILHNNAGILRGGTVLDMSENEWDELMDVNVKSIFLVSKHVLPHMIRQGGGSVINAGSSWGIVAQPGYDAYFASKGAVHMLTKAMAVDFAPNNIRINAVAPGYIRTPLTMKAIEESENPKEERIASGRLCDPEEIAHGVLFLASDECPYMVGTILVMDGGETTKGGAVKELLPLREKDEEEINTYK